jgi:CHAT domain-containing protein
MDYRENSFLMWAMFLDFKMKFLFFLCLSLPMLVSGQGSSLVPGQGSSLVPVESKLNNGQFDEALDLLIKMDTSALSQDAKITFSLFLGEAYLKLGRNNEALKTLKSVEVNLKDRSTVQAANCFEDLGIVYWNNGNKTTALSYHEKALNIRKKLLGSNDIKIADSYNNIGLIYLSDEFLQAIIYFNKALNIYLEQLGDKSTKVALVYSNLAFANSGQGNHADAIRYLDEVGEIWENAFQGNHPNKAYTLSNKGLIYLKQENFQQAEVFQKQALEMYQDLYDEKHPEIANTYFLLGNIALQKADYKKAVKLYQQSIYANLIDQQFQNSYDHPTIDAFLNADILLSSLQAKAKALEVQHFEKSLKPKDLIAALESYRLADELVSRIRQLRKNESDKLQLSKIANQLYENAITLALILAESTIHKNQYLEEAFRYCERSKSAILLEAIAETHAKQFAGIPEELIQIEDSLKSQINFFEQKLAEGKGNIDVLKDQLFNYEQGYRQLIEQVEKDYPKYYDLKFNTSVVTVQEIKTKLKSFEALVSYFIGEEKIFIFTITNKKLIVETKDKPKKFNSLINGYRNSIKYRVKNVYDQQSTTLFALLVSESLKNILKIQIIPAGILSTIPFEALTETIESQPLITSRSIAYDYSSTLWFNRTQNEIPNEGGILLNAPVTFQKNDVQMIDLPGTEKEIKEIKYLFMGSNIKPTMELKKSASESNFKSTDLSNFKYIHFATHGLVNESKPELSRIFLSPDNSDDGSLFSGEIYNLNMNVSLVTLSACETGLGKVEKGEGVMGLSRALMYAGAQNLIVSLWKVSDSSTADLMVSFYGDLVYNSGKPNFSSALRKAKISLINSEKYSDPYYWAPFILVGN